MMTAREVKRKDVADYRREAPDRRYRSERNSAAILSKK
jgi:hypothetical protein